MREESVRSFWVKRIGNLRQADLTDSNIMRQSDSVIFPFLNVENNPAKSDQR